VKGWVSDPSLEVWGAGSVGPPRPCPARIGPFRVLGEPAEVPGSPRAYWTSESLQAEVPFPGPGRRIVPINPKASGFSTIGESLFPMGGAPQAVETWGMLGPPVGDWVLTWRNGL